MKYICVLEHNKDIHWEYHLPHPDNVPFVNEAIETGYGGKVGDFKIILIEHNTSDGETELVVKPLGEMVDPNKKTDEITLPAPTGINRMATIMSLVNTPDYYATVLRAGNNVLEDDEGESYAMVPTWVPYSKTKPVPAECHLPITTDAIQGMFDSLWRDGYRPNGYELYLQEFPLDRIDKVLESQLENFQAHLAEYAKRVSMEEVVFTSEQAKLYESLYVEGKLPLWNQNVPCIAIIEYSEDDVEDDDDDDLVWP